MSFINILLPLLLLLHVHSYFDGGPETLCLNYYNPNYDDALDCPYGIYVSWIQQPPNYIIELTSFEADYELHTAPGVEGICVHGNLHACKVDVGVICYPTLKDSAGLVTSSEAILNVPLVNGTCRFHSVTTLPAGTWTVIAHVRISVHNESVWDAAIGVTRTCTPWVIPVAVIIPCVVLIALAIIIYFICRLRTQDTIDLPPSLMWFFNRQRVSKKYSVKEKKHVSYYYKNVQEGSKEYQFFMTMKETLDWGKIPIKSIIAVVCLPLVQTFSNYRAVLNNRARDDPDNFYAEDWKNDDPGDQRSWTMGVFQRKTKQYEWNQNLKPTNTTILPVVHGTDKSIAKKIVANGFAALSGLDNGWYGKGIYFSTSVQYVTPYFAIKNKPSVLVCLLLPGNPYPVTESHHSEKSLMGSHIKRGYQSNYVVTNKSGLPVGEQSRSDQYDEIVIEQQAQVIPIFIVELEKDNIEKLLELYNRAVVQPTLREKSNVNVRTTETKAKENEVLDMPILPLPPNDEFI